MVDLKTEPWFIQIFFFQRENGILFFLSDTISLFFCFYNVEAVKLWHYTVSLIFKCHDVWHNLFNFTF